VGIISAVSNHFCQTCNRVRLSAKGDLILCLGQEDAISLKDAVRSDLTSKIINLHLPTRQSPPFVGC
jgi:cyclic pyranopterin phosphate synthase